jgi:hypothetical protein
MINDLSNVVLWLIRAGVAFRLAYCLFRMIFSEEEQGQYKKRAINTVVFYVLAESVWGIKGVVVGYFG